jgi:Na+-translocating ferredoxin:NAD+ oxidoreductase RNF subunit RnfB
MALIHIDNDKCDACLHCVRACPVHAIKVSVTREFPAVDDDRCIGCGACLNVCQPGAIIYTNSVDTVFKLLNSGDKVAAIVDPSISGEFPDITDYRKFVEMIRALGFDYVNEVSFGVDLVARAYHKLVDEFKGKHYLFSLCPAIVHYVRKYYPDLVDNLAPLISPADTTAMVVRAVFGSDIKVVLIGPCIAPKMDIEARNAESKIDAALTFVELREMFELKNVHESQLEFSDFDPPIGRLGSLFPFSNGIVQAAGLNESLTDGKVITVEGNTESLKSVGSFDKHIGQVQRNMNIFFDCGCSMGPGMSPGGDKRQRDAFTVNYVQKRLKDFDTRKWEEEMEKFAYLDLKTSFAKDDQRLPKPKAKQMNEILHLLGKTDHDENIACSACGFDNCKDFATAVAQGITRTDVCLDYSIKNKNNYIHSLKESGKKTDEQLKSLKEELKQLIGANELLNDKLETSRSIMGQIPSGVVIVDDNLKITSSNKSFIDLLGDEAKEIDDIIPGLRGADLKSLVPVQFYKVFQNVLESGENIFSRDVKIEESYLNLSVFSIKKGKVVGGLIRDMFSPEVQNEQVIQRITDVIDQNLEMVQQIGFLLGEGASKTEAMLNTIIQLQRRKKK